MKRMQKESSQEWMNEEEWRRWHYEIERLIREVWVVALLAELLLLLFFEPTAECSRSRYFWLFVVRPSGLQLLTLVCYIFHRRQKPRRHIRWKVELGTILGFSTFVGIMVCVHTSVSTMPMLLVLPMMLTCLYRNRSMIVTQGVILVAIYLADSLYFIPNSPYMPTENRITEGVVFVMAVLGAFRFVILIKNVIFRKEERSNRDSLTYLYNHERFYEELEYYQRRYKEQGEQFSIAIADIDNFKKVNDTYGHAFGDTVIQQVARLCREESGKETFCARYGGEEFAMIFPNKDKKEAIRIADKVRRGFAEHAFETEAGIKNFTLSIGIAEYDKEYPSASAFFDKADQALYRAKSEGKNCVRL